MDPVATETTETPVVEAKVTDKLVEDVEDTPLVASGEEAETVAPVEEATTTTTTKTEEETPAVESSGDAVEVTENGNGEAAVVVEPVVEEAVEESIKRKAGDEETPVVPEKKAKTDDVEVEAEVVEKVTA